MKVQFFKFDRALIFLIAIMETMCPLNAENRVWKPETILELKSIKDVDVSPDGKEVVYTVTEAMVKNNNNSYISQVWRGKVDDLQSHIQFTNHEKSSCFPRWSPDGLWIAFLSDRTGVKNLFLVSAKDEEVVQITDLDADVETFRWAPDSKRIAFVSQIEESSGSAVATNLSDQVEIYPKKSKIPQLFVIKAEPVLQTPIRITTSEYKIVGEVVLDSFDWSPNSERIAFTYTADVGEESLFKNAQIAIVDVETKKVGKLPKIAAHQSIPKFSPDGKLLAFLKSDEKASFPQTRRITLYSFSNKQFRELPKTPDESPFIYGPSLLGWSNDGTSVLYLEPLRTKFAIWNIPIDKDKMVRIDDGNWVFNNPLLSSNRKWLGIALETLNAPPEAYVTSSADFIPQKISRVNEHLKKWKMPFSKVIRWKSYDGKEIEGLLTYPKSYRAGTCYPLLLVVHGGPMGVFSENYLGSDQIYPLAAFADEDFVILRANPRGSCGYGLDFRYAVSSDWGGIDFQDLMSGVDSLIEMGLADPDRMGVMGWSYGGYLSAWAITQTDRFSAASMGAAIINLTSFGGTTDICSFVSDYMGGEAWDLPSLYLERSPVTFINRISTPLLIQHGENDSRVPFSQAVEFYNGLRKLGKPVSLAVYPRSGHRILEPQLQVDALQRNFNWFLENLKNKRV